MDAKLALLVALGLFALIYLVVLVRGVRQSQESKQVTKPTIGGLLTGFGTNFFDTLGIGSFATTTAIWRKWRMVRDEQIPGTLNVGHTLPTVVQAFIFTTLVQVEPLTLISMILAAVLGAWLGAGVVSGLPRRGVQLGMGLALLLASGFAAARALDILPAGTAIGLVGWRLAAGVLGNFLLGALMTLGVGLYGPCMVLIAVLGMNSQTAFPIMMGSCAFLMPIATARFVRERAFDARAALALLIGGLPAVFLAAPIVVGDESGRIIKWLVVVVVLYAAVTLLLAARREPAPVVPVPNEPGIATP